VEAASFRVVLHKLAILDIEVPAEQEKLIFFDAGPDEVERHEIFQ
jgi:hypothetical protein